MCCRKTAANIERREPARNPQELSGPTGFDGEIQLHVVCKQELAKSIFLHSFDALLRSFSCVPLPEII